MGVCLTWALTMKSRLTSSSRSSLSSLAPWELWKGVLINRYVKSTMICICQRFSRTGKFGHLHRLEQSPHLAHKPDRLIYFIAAYKFPLLASALQSSLPIDLWSILDSLFVDSECKVRLFPL
jgi:hypothetical protein